MEVHSIRSSNEVLNVPDFWTRMAFARRRFLSLDYDGTLAPFRIDRSAAFPLPGIIDALNEIDGSPHTFLSVVSGRPIAELSSLLGDLDVTLVGSHGHELKMPDQEPFVMEANKEQRTGLAEARRIAEENDLATLIESKVASIAIHTRGLDYNESEWIEKLVVSLWSAIASAHHLQCVRFNGGVELRTEGWNTGETVMTLLCASRADFAVYIGDDETDEDVFRSLRNSGIGIRVGDPDIFTEAIGILQDCQAVREFLKTWRSLDAA